MSDLSITFSQPWLLLLILPGLALVLFAFFRVSKQFRYTRNRVICLSLGIVMVFACGLMAAGIGFQYAVANEANEVLLLVDASFSDRENMEQKDEFIRSVIEENADTAKLGIVTFGYDQVYAAPLSDDAEAIFENYRNAPPPDDSATDLAAALAYAEGLISHPESAKIVVLTDGIETDGDALETLSALARTGIRVDLVGYAAAEGGDEVEITALSLPEDGIEAGENVQLALTVQTNRGMDARISLYDNGEEALSEYAELSEGSNTLYVTHAFETTGLHELYVTIEGVSDTLSQNNSYYSFVNIEVVDNILILQRENEGEQLLALYEGDFEVTLKDIEDAPATLRELREYDEVILANIANADMPEGFDELLESYVSEAGGSLLTVGGAREENGESVANVYNREDMEGTLYQEMLPVLAEDYTPPVAVMLVIDVSGSMEGTGASGKKLIEEAQESAKASLDALDDRDYLGIVTFSEDATLVLAPTPVAERRNIETAIDKIVSKMQGTIYTHALDTAGLALKSVEGVNQKHIVFISDGNPNETDGRYIDVTKSNLEAGITTSCISFMGEVGVMQQIADAGEGRNYTASSGDALTDAIQEDLSTPEIREFEYVTFQPQFGEYSSVLSGIDEAALPTLDGFFGVRLKNGAQGILIGEYGQPIYAEWAYGSGKVGSFMCDLSGVWSADFLADETGRQLIDNILSGLFPMESVREEEIELSVARENYTVGTNIYTSIAEGESIRVLVGRVQTDGAVTPLHTLDVENFDGNETAYFDITEGGVYEIEVQKLAADGSVLASSTRYEAFSYSLEYEAFAAGDDIEAHIAALASAGGGQVITQPSAVFEGLSPTLTRSFDPRGVLAVIVIIALLLDVAVRKFKFKWPHELIREKRDKKAADSLRERSVTK